MSMVPIVKLPTRQLGRNGPLVTALGYGAMGLSISYGSAGSDEERFKILDAVYERGILFWDTADVYNDNEDLIGNWFKRTGKRSEIFLASKFGAALKPNGEAVIRSDPDYVFEACEKSLKRLGVDCIDLYYHHRLDMKTPIEKTVAAMAKLKEQVL
jgi:aryl-alcohol dehydrogenase-like predicted oxidoreductase